MSQPANPTFRPKRGGPDYHKPGCGCNACVARRRKAEAQLERAGSDGDTLPVPSESQAPILTDLPPGRAGVKRQRVAMWLKWKAIEPELTQKEAAARLGIATQTLTNYLYEATKEGWLKFNDPLNELRYEIMPMVTRNLKYHLEQGDKDITIKTAQGTIFKQFLDSEGIKDAPTTVLALKIEMPAAAQLGAANPQIKGVIVGTPRTPTEIIDVEPKLVTKD